MIHTAAHATRSMTVQTVSRVTTPTPAQESALSTSHLKKASLLVTVHLVRGLSERICCVRLEFARKLRPVKVMTPQGPVFPGRSHQRIHGHAFRTLTARPGSMTRASAPVDRTPMATHSVNHSAAIHPRQTTAQCSSPTVNPTTSATATQNAATPKPVST